MGIFYYLAGTQKNEIRRDKQKHMKAGDKLYCVKDFYRHRQTHTRQELAIFKLGNWYEIMEITEELGYWIYSNKLRKITERFYPGNAYFMTEKELRKTKIKKLHERR
jgi:hypothetical protein